MPIDLQHMSKHEKWALGAGVLAGGLVLYYLWKKGSSSSTQPTSTDGFVTPDLSQYPVSVGTGSSGGVSGGGSGGDTSTGPSDTPNPTPPTDQVPPFTQPTTQPPAPNPFDPNVGSYSNGVWYGASPAASVMPQAPGATSQFAPSLAPFVSVTQGPSGQNYLNIGAGAPGLSPDQQPYAPPVTYNPAPPPMPAAQQSPASAPAFQASYNNGFYDFPGYDPGGLFAHEPSLTRGGVGSPSGQVQQAAAGIHAIAAQTAPATLTGGQASAQLQQAVGGVRSIIRSTPVTSLTYHG